MATIQINYFDLGLFVATSHINTGLLAYNHIGHLMFENICFISLIWMKYVRNDQ